MSKIMIFLLVFSASLCAEIEIDLESGAIFSGYNDVGIPGDIGTKFSLTEDLETKVKPFFRARVNYHFNPKHHISILYAPLEVEATGKIGHDVFYQRETFAANTDLTSKFKFNSYRFTYRYDFVHRADLTFGMGFTAKIRDAFITLENSEKKAEKTNVGFVPIINFRLDWKFRKPLSLVLEGDALAAPQGRAEDIAIALKYQIRQNLAIRGGYRILEGGADNDEVYTFSLFHYACLGLSYSY